MGVGVRARPPPCSRANIQHSRCISPRPAQSLRNRPSPMSDNLHSVSTLQRLQRFLPGLWGAVSRWSTVWPVAVAGAVVEGPVAWVGQWSMGCRLSRKPVSQSPSLPVSQSPLLPALSQSPPSPSTTSLPVPSGSPPHSRSPAPLYTAPVSIPRALVPCSSPDALPAPHTDRLPVGRQPHGVTHCSISARYCQYGRRHRLVVKSLQPLAKHCVKQS
jgi:hypothetical protein